MADKLRIAFMGTPDFVAPTMQALIDSAHEVVCVYTQPPREKGRHKKLEKTPIHILAESLGIEVRHPANFKEASDVEAFKDLNLDVAVVAAFGMLLPQAILDAPKHGCINVHPSLLPRWRGPSPVQYAIWKGDAQTGVSVMSLEKSMDTGPILAQGTCDITDEITFTQLNEVLWIRGTVLLEEVLEKLTETGALNPKVQSDEGVSYCKLFTKEQGLIDFNNTAIEIDRQIRGLNPWPGTWCHMSDGKRLKVIEASVVSDNANGGVGEILDGGVIACGDDSGLQLNVVQPENKKPMDIAAALNGGYLKVGEFLK